MLWKWVSRLAPEENGGFLQVSGSSYTIDISVPSSVELDEKGNFVKVNGAYRVSDILVDGQPLDLNKTYTVASHNYMLLEAGDGMSMFKGCNVLKKDIAVDVDALYTYINQTLGGNVGGDYAKSSRRRTHYHPVRKHGYLLIQHTGKWEVRTGMSLTSHVII